VYNGELCAQLQLMEEAPTGRGLAALAGGACRGRLRRLVLAPPGSLGSGGGFPIRHVAALLGDGCCPQLEELELHVQLDLGALEQLGVADEVAAAGEWQQQVATAEVLQGWLAAGEVTEGLEQGMACVEMLLERQLEALGVVGAELDLAGFVNLEGGARLHPVLEGRVGGCAVSWTLFAA
jgi:hypothetical protein